MDSAVKGKARPDYGRGTVELTEEIERDEFLSKLKKEVKERIVGDQLNLPMLPHMAVQVLQLASNPRATFEEIEKLVKQDALIAARLLKLANSPFYRGISPITSIKQAIGRVGLKHLLDMVFSLSVQAKIFRGEKELEAEMKRLWEHSLAVAFAAQLLAKTIRIDSEYAFLCGLLHDIGKPVLLNLAIEVAKKEKKEIDFADLQGWLSEYHAQVGAMIATRWGMSKLIVDAIFHHHNYESATDARDAATVVYLANLICHHFGYGCEKTEVDLTQERAFYLLNFSPAQVSDVATKFPEMFEEIRTEL